MIILKPQSDIAGMIRFNVPIFGADEWSCRTTGESVEVGDRVVVNDIIGNDLIVASTQRVTNSIEHQRSPSIATSIAPSITQNLTANRDSVIPKDKVRASRLDLDKPNLDSVRLKNKFDNK